MSTEPAIGVVKRSISIAGHRTSISLEEPFWQELQLIASQRGISVQRLVGEIDEGRAGQNLSSALRVFVLRETQMRANTATASESIGEAVPASRAAPSVPPSSRCS